MAKLLKLRRGTTSQHSSFTGAEGEVTIDTTKDTAVVHDGSQAGGRPLAREDMSNVSSANIAGQLGTDSIATSKIAGGALPTDVTVASANIVNGTIVTADLADNAVATAKVVDNAITTAKVNDNNVTTAKIADNAVTNSQLADDAVNGAKIADDAVGTEHITANAVGSSELADNAVDNAAVASNAAIAGTKISPDFGSQAIATTGTLGCDDITITGTKPKLVLNDSNNENDFHIQNDDGTFAIKDIDSNTGRLTIASNGQTTIPGNLDCGAGVDVTGNITVSGTVDGVDVAALNTTVGNLSLSGSTLANGTTATTQSAGDATTKVATTAFVGTAVSNLVDSSPSALNTLNELAAAIGDDANFSTTITNSIAGKLATNGNGSSVTNLNASALASGTIPDARFPSVLPARSAANLTSIPAGNLTGTVADARISTLTASKLSGALPAIDGSNLTGISAFVSGMIMLWSGGTASIPSGWVICNGSNSTPDLRDRFVVGAGNSYSVGNTGGANSVTLSTSQIPSHSHTYQSMPDNNIGWQSYQHSNAYGSYANDNGATFNSGSTGGGGSHENRPPYYALVYIMKT